MLLSSNFSSCDSDKEQPKCLAACPGKTLGSACSYSSLLSLDGTTKISGDLFSEEGSDLSLRIENDSSLLPFSLDCSLKDEH